MHVAREYGNASHGVKAQQPREMQSSAGSSPMLERWQRETAREGPFHNIDAIIVERRDQSSNSGKDRKV